MPVEASPKPSTILLSASRSGSNYFLDVYEKVVPGTFVLGEIFNNNGGSLPRICEELGWAFETIREHASEQPLVLWNALLEHAESSNRGLIAKVFYYHSRNHPDLWSFLYRNSRFIHLVRRNQFNCYLSLLRANQTNRWFEKQHQIEKEEKVKISMSVAETKEFIRRRVNQVKRARRKLAGVDHVEIAYEDIQSSADQCAQVISSICGTNRVDYPIVSGLRKQKTRRNYELVSNYSEVAHLDRNWL